MWTLWNSDDTYAYDLTQGTSDQFMTTSEASNMPPYIHPQLEGRCVPSIWPMCIMLPTVGPSQASGFNKEGLKA